jgi:DME family drug/metabolite transporter
LPSGHSLNTTRGYIIALTGTVIWSTTAVFIQMPALVLAFWRDLFVCLALLLVFAIFMPRLLKISRQNLGFSALIGVVLALFNTLWTLSVVFNGAALSTVLVYASAAFTALAGWRLFGEKLSMIKISAILLSLAGCVLVSGAYDPSAWQLNTVGILTGIISGIAFTAYTLLGKASINRGILSWTSLCYTFGFAAIFLFAFNYIAMLFGQPAPQFLWLGNSLPGWGMLLLLSLFSTIGGYGLYNASMHELQASTANLIATLEPALTTLQAYLFLGERLTLLQIIGSLSILSGVILLRLMDKPPSTSV